MSNLNDAAWEKLFAKYAILDKIESSGRFNISAAQIKEFREPRLMAKFDHTINLPKLFADNKLSILPITRGDYVISHFDAYHRFEEAAANVERAALPSHIQSLDSANISSEAIALNCALASGIIADFLQEERLVPTVSGRMGSGAFGFAIRSRLDGYYKNIDVNNSQIEIDAAYEGEKSLALLEAKRDISEDFLVRQLYYPFRTWQERVTKPVRTLYLVYSNGIYRLYEYAFQEIGSYNSLTLVRQKNYSVEDTAISIDDIKETLERTHPEPEPKTPFPQADSFERVINICELLGEHGLSRADVTSQYAFDVRQTNYYTDAARYLGLLTKERSGAAPVYRLSESGRRVLRLKYKQRQLAFCSLILSHGVFNKTLRLWLLRGKMPQTVEIVDIMKQAGLYRVESESTYGRRASTVKGWLGWVLGLVSGE